MADESRTRESVDSLLEALVKTPGAGTAKPLAPGTILDEQYEIVRALGQGGMGVVYLARDRRLDRDVALKLGHVVSETALGRIEREAVALARLQHPNVVVIHQVGEADGRLYIAMEYVDGGNAREWLAARKRTWREIVALYAAAGDGLAAAHAAGFVHRDFKPDNVLVGADGRPRVADFGLVRGRLSPDGEIDVVGTEPRGSSAPGSGATTHRMTATGAVVGTPAYMPPEQIAGDDIDGRADQFAFSAALWEALFAARPYAGKTPAEIAVAIETSAPRPPADAGGVPRHVIAALRRGLDRDREARWPSMPVLLAELRRDPRARRRVAVIAIGAAVAAAIGAYAIARTRAGSPCGDGASIIATTWSPARAQAMTAAFAHAGLGQGEGAIRAAFDRYAAAWAIAHDDACHATRVDGSQSEAIMDRRMLCLGRARDRLDAIAAAMIGGDRAALASAPEATALLPDLARCADVASFANQAPLPADPTARAKIDAAAALVTRAETIGLDADAPDPRALADRAIAAAQDAGWPPLVAEAALARADLLDPIVPPDESAPEYQHAAELALAAGDDATAAMAYADLALTDADRGRLDEARAITAVAHGLWMRSGKPPEVGARIEGAAAAIAMIAGDSKTALDAIRSQVAMVRAAFPDNAIDEADNHLNLANALEHAGQLDESYREIHEAVRVAEQHEGPTHPILSTYLIKAAEIAQQAGRGDEALVYARRALAVTQAWYGADDPRVGNALGQLGTLVAMHGDPEEARVDLERAIAIGGRRGERSIDSFQLDDALAVVEARTGHFDRAIEASTRSLARQEQLEGPGNANLSSPLVTRGISYRQLGKLDESRADLERAAAILAKALGDDAPDPINARIELSYTLVAQHRARDAAALLEPYLAFSEKADFAPSVAAELHTALADALWQAGGDRTRARALADQGRAIYATLGDSFAAERARAEAWLAAHQAR